MKRAYKRIRGSLSTDWLKKYEGTSHNLMLEAMTNPDLLSDEQTIYPERDFDAEEDRRAFIRLFVEALETLTDQQKRIVKAIQVTKGQEEAAKILGIQRSTLAVSLMQIKKKLLKHINKRREEGQNMEDTYED